MPPVFGPSSPSNARLWSCAGANGTRVAPVAQHEQRQLGTGQALLDHARAARVAERVARQVRAHRVARLGDRLGDDHALARGEAVGLDHVEPGQRLEERERAPPRRRRRTCACRAVGTPGASRARPSSTPSSPSRRGRGGGRSEREVAARASSASTTPATSGSSGPTTTRSASSSSASATTAAGSSASTGDALAERRPCPGCRARRRPRRRAASARDPTRARARGRRRRRRGRARHVTRRGAARRSGRAPGRHRRSVTGHAGELLDEPHVVARRGGSSSSRLGLLDVGPQPGSVS